MSLGGLGKGGGTTTTNDVSRTLDPARAGLQTDVIANARRVAGQPFNQFAGDRTAQFGPEFQQGSDLLRNIDPRLAGGFAGAAQGLGLGQDAFQQFLQQRGPGGGLDFNDANVARFSDPFTQQVIDAQGQTFDRFRDRAVNDIGDQFQGAGAFGGSRQAVTEGARLGELDRAEAEQIAGLRSRGFENATNALFNQQGRFDQFTGQQLGAAGNLANLGFGGLQGLQGLIQSAGAAGIDIGQLLRGNAQGAIDRDRQAFDEPRQRELQNAGLLSGTLSGLPQGQFSGTNTQTEQQSFNPLSAGLGLAGTVFGGPLGGAIGSGISSLFGRGGPDTSGQTVNALSPFGSFR